MVLVNVWCSTNHNDNGNGCLCSLLLPVASSECTKNAAHNCCPVMCIRMIPVGSVPPDFFFFFFFLSGSARLF